MKRISALDYSERAAMEVYPVSSLMDLPLVSWSDSRRILSRMSQLLPDHASHPFALFLFLEHAYSQADPTAADTREPSKIPILALSARSAVLPNASCPIKIDIVNPMPPSHATPKR
jgi:hypothetical protein